MSNTPVSLAATMNNEAVRSFENGNYEKAIASFTTALTHVKQMLSDGGDDDYVDGESSIEFVPGESIVADHEGYRSIYCQPIILSGQASSQCIESYNKASFAIMFNLALSHHLCGMQSSTSQGQNKLKKALRLYEFAYSVLMQQDLQLAITYTLAMVNNLGQIQELLGDHQKAKQCFQHLLSTLMFVLEGGDIEDLEDQWDVFFQNVTHLVLKETPFAAAA